MGVVAEQVVYSQSSSCWPWGKPVARFSTYISVDRIIHKIFAIEVYVQVHWNFEKLAYYQNMWKEKFSDMPVILRISN